MSSPGAGRDGCPAPKCDPWCACRHASWPITRVSSLRAYLQCPLAHHTGPFRCRNGACALPVARTGALVGTPLLFRPVAGRIYARASGWEPLMTLRTPDRARLTPGYVHLLSFRLARLGRRGLDEDDVRDFCARVEDELARLLEELASLYAEVRRLRGRAQARNRARRPCRSRSAVFVPGVPGRAGSRGSGLDARKRVRNINPSGFTLPTHPGTTPETPTAESTCQESERVVV